MNENSKNQKRKKVLYVLTQNDHCDSNMKITRYKECIPYTILYVKNKKIIFATLFIHISLERYITVIVGYSHIIPFMPL